MSCLKKVTKCLESSPILFPDRSITLIGNQDANGGKIYLTSLADNPESTKPILATESTPAKIPVPLRSKTQLKKYNESIFFKKRLHGKKSEIK
jgi:hypothetical protein